MTKKVTSKISYFNFSQKNRRGQIWVETVIYTLIAFSLIALVLGFAKPEIEELRDKSILQQSLEMMEDLDILITEVLQACTGNKRVIEVAIRKGDLRLDGSNDQLLFEFEGKYIYSEPGENIQQGNLNISTEEVGKLGLINITRDYSDYNITYYKEDNLKILSKATTPYKIFISNLGKDESGKTIINIELN
ncbi:hypothetical protein KAI04_03745 [Candidatus Pacearchaeota archaeon]|nr:hypothetical protein [Candidatus Pacearchaeota archaeon]